MANEGNLVTKDPRRRLFKYPYALAAQCATTGTGVEINGGAIQQGETRNFPENAYLNALDRPFIISHAMVSVTRVAGGEMVDSDFDNIFLNVRDLVRNEDVTKDPIPLSVLFDPERRIWLFSPGQLILRRNGGGLTIKMFVNPGAVGAPYNTSLSFLGHTERYGDVSPDMAPPED